LGHSPVDGRDGDLAWDERERDPGKPVARQRRLRRKEQRPTKPRTHDYGLESDCTNS
jgi:hypothetical protein